MIKVIALDLGGVVFTNGQEKVLPRLAREQGYDPDVIKNLLSCPESIALRRGHITDEQFWTWAQENLPAGYHTEMIKQAYYDAYEPDTHVFPLVQRLHAQGGFSTCPPDEGHDPHAVRHQLPRVEGGGGASVWHGGEPR